MPLRWASPEARGPRWRLPLALALGVWLCTLPLVGIAVALGLPWEAAWPVLGTLLVVDLLVCHVLCRTRLRGWRQRLDVRDSPPVGASILSERER
ncbi:MAG: hypothetical protein HY684_00745 [Chloroflexi bacterium]|nr:hypothetical protein [Chloroflexota bacterium]